MITKETPTEEILGMLIQVNDELNTLNYRENESQYNYLETKRRNLEDIILIRKENDTLKLDLNPYSPTANWVQPKI